MPIGALSSAASGLAFQELNVRVIANNIATMNVTAGKTAIAVAKDRGYQTYQGAGAPTSAQNTLNPTGTYVGMGVGTAGIVRVMAQGDVEMTDSPLDVMINGEGYLAVQLPDGETAYTRDGRLQMNRDRQIVTMDGYTVQPSLTIPANTVQIDINQEGQVYATIQGQTTQTLVGQFELNVFPNAAGLEPIGSSLYTQNAASGTPTTGVAGQTGFGKINQFQLESSNVKPVNELTALIQAQRAYAMNTKSMTAVEQMDQNLQSLMR